MDEISETECKSSSQKSRNNLRNTKKLSRVPKEDKVKEENADKANVLTLLCDKYQCVIHNNKYCYIEGDRHLNLTVLHLKLWTTEIVIIKFYEFIYLI